MVRKIVIKTAKMLRDRDREIYNLLATEEMAKERILKIAE